MKNSTIIWIVVIVFILLIGIGVWVYMQGKKTPATPPIVLPGQPVPATDVFKSISDFFTNLFKRKEAPPAYVQVAPIDEVGCDALGNNRFGFKCIF